MIATQGTILVRERLRSFGHKPDKVGKQHTRPCITTEWAVLTWKYSSSKRFSGKRTWTRIQTINWYQNIEFNPLTTRRLIPWVSSVRCYLYIKYFNTKTMSSCKKYSCNTHSRLKSFFLLWWFCPKKSIKKVQTENSRLDILDQIKIK